MTVLVGILCKDGVVVGSDSSATFSIGNLRTIEQKTKKVHIHHDQVILAGTGQVGLDQRFNELLHLYWPSTKIYPNKTHIQICRELSAHGISDFQITGLKPGGYAAVLAFHRGECFHLCEFDQNNFQPEQKNENIWYVSLGSGQLIMDSFLGFIRRAFWHDEQPNLTDGIFTAVWALHQTIELNTGGINGPMQISILEKVDGVFNARKLMDEEIAQHMENVRGMENYVSKYKNKFTENPAVIPSFTQNFSSEVSA